jgi:DNA-binding MarR family transcriptional regulator
VAKSQRLELDSYFPYLINRVGSALVLRFSEEALVRHRLSIAMWRVLAVLSNNGEQRQIDLAGLTSIGASTLSRLVRRLVRMRLVRRRRSTADSREVVVELSRAGRALVDRLIPIARELERRAIAGLPARELAVARRALRRMHGNLADTSELPRRPRSRT